jgi:ectoine hydroxylase-related dioxygenase (phytanoyl-CoA dioxygenase family)
VNAELDHLLEQGYVILREIIGPGTVAAVHDQLDPYLQGRYPGRNDFEGYQSERVYGLLDKAPVIADLVAHPQVLALLDAVMEPNYLLSACLAIQLNPGETAQTWHYDDAFVTIPKPRPWYFASAIWAIDEFTRANGATHILPGSHRWGGEPISGDRDDMVVAEMPPGSVVVFLGTTVHRGGDNRTAAKRLAVSPQYGAPWARPQETFMLSVRKEMAARYPERVQELLGYSIHPPFMGHADGRHPRKHLDPAFHDAAVSARSGSFWEDWEQAGSRDQARSPEQA